jgi:hypothetical protein
MSDVPKGDLHREDWCARLEQAVTDGRFLEDPAHWRAHVNQCSACRQTVEGVFLLRDFVGQARMDADLGDQPPLVGEEIVAEALSRHRAERQRLLMFWSMGVSVVLLVGGLFLFTRTPSEPPATARTQADLPATAANDDPVAYALALHKRVAPPGAPDRYDLVEQDDALRNELLKALDHPSSFVRRMALWDLTSSGIQLEPARIEQFLTTFDETLDGPVTTAYAGSDPARQVLDTLAQRRSQTLLSALRSAGTQATQGGLAVRQGAITPYLLHPEWQVREGALGALSLDTTYEPGAVEARLLESDPEDRIRLAAATTLITRLQDRGAAQVIAYLRAKRDWHVEQLLTGTLGRFPDGLVLARQRVEDPTTPMVVALLHALILARNGERAAALRLVPRAVSDGDVYAVHLAVKVAQELGTTEVRDGLQARWRRDRAQWLAVSPTGASDIADALLLWDEASAGEARLHLALDVIEDLGADRTWHARKVLDRLTESTIASLRQRAAKLRGSAGPVK